MCTYKNIYKCKKSIYTHVHKSYRKIVFFRYKYMANILCSFSDKININLFNSIFVPQLIKIYLWNSIYFWKSISWKYTTKYLLLSIF